MVMSLSQLDPNYVVSFKYSRENLAQILAEFSVRGLDVVTRPGPDVDTVYAFTRVNGVENDHTLTISQDFDFVKSVIPLYDHKVSKQLDGLFAKFTKHEIFGVPSDGEIHELGRLTGNPHMSLYFAFFKNYIKWLLPLAAVGLFFRVCFSSWEFNKLYVMCLYAWSLGFTAHWIYRKKSHYIQLFGDIHESRNLFKNEGTVVEWSTPAQVVLRKCCFIPIALMFASVLVTFQLLCFSIEIFITQLYSGPLVSVLSLLPTVLLSSFTPILTMVYNSVFVEKFVKWENSPNPKKSKMEKNFVLTFFVSYVPLLITLFIYLPLGYRFSNSALGAKISLNASRYYIPTKASDFKINFRRYKDQFFYFTVTNQVVSMFLENALPYIIGRGMDIIVRGATKPDSELSIIRSNIKKTHPDELLYWSKIDSYVNGQWGAFDADENIRKVIIQFGYLAMFSTIWPLAPFIYLLFDMIIIKLDLWRAIKKCTPSSVSSQEVGTPNGLSKSVTDTWNVIMEVVLLAAAVVGPTITYMYASARIPNVGRFNDLEKRETWYANDPIPHSWSNIGFFAFLMENGFLLIYFIVSKAMAVLDEDGTKGYVPTISSKIPQKTDLLPVTRETNDFMERIESELKAKKTKVKQETGIKRRKRVAVRDISKVPVDTEGEVYRREKVSTAVIAKVEDEHLSSDECSSDTLTEPQQIHSLPKFKKVIDAPAIIKTIPRTNDQQAFTTENVKSPNMPPTAIAGATLPQKIPVSDRYEQGLATNNPQQITHTKRTVVTKEVDNIFPEQNNAGGSTKAAQTPVSRTQRSDTVKSGHQSLDGNQLATLAAATAVNADMKNERIAPLREQSDGQKEVPREEVEPVGNISGVRRSFTLRRKSVASSKSAGNTNDTYGNVEPPKKNKSIFKKIKDKL
ncbi:uncharacterized protein KNAG_0H00870 [Huiozyma naganishii CBS 8797]|uniref:Anoctamin transmembrane domain-containing protein n=1 Tax=Huiozyma naganishii (strain ATCC MYA-139 / BCRC 22969 / CBS 8797 / KCTC 17520 / NBRC 10181 / NCYC 3082 / Yp74L-3) TaxID=1071383 RepID=J7S1L6_HUIN7|nr:hypothetical protein KNAG_0H00870 [Kazachstania naganishii CBS 8797]CCK71502.1 hypothetical protein KNAG_0H00870 [Kazachstania naganishii CBS 8797]